MKPNADTCPRCGQQVPPKRVDLAEVRDCPCGHRSVTTHGSLRDRMLLCHDAQEKTRGLR